MTIEEAIRKYVNIPIQVTLAKVDKVNEDTCDVLLLNNDKIKRVARLQAITHLSEGIIITPKVGSLILVGMIDNEPQSAFIIDYAEIKESKVKINNVELTINEKGFNIKKDDVDILKLMEEFINIISKIIVVQGKGPDISALKLLQNNFKKLLWS